jgi:hypothetical protein
VASPRALLFSVDLGMAARTERKHMGWIPMNELDLQRIEVLTEVLAGRQESSGQAYAAIAGER